MLFVLSLAFAQSTGEEALPVRQWQSCSFDWVDPLPAGGPELLINGEPTYVHLYAGVRPENLVKHVPGYVAGTLGGFSMQDAHIVVDGVTVDHYGFLSR